MRAIKKKVDKNHYIHMLKRNITHTFYEDTYIKY